MVLVVVLSENFLAFNRKRRLREDQNLWAASAPPQIGSSPESEPPTSGETDSSTAVELELDLDRVHHHLRWLIHHLGLIVHSL
ncbi:hypothetical protein V6N12_061748 [Hibiscus sabdariffa]|uniref:Uncharacterized protein n=1 Tax=Hibiscus sabdariffa TaxID=183260 RepID=A0ABR2DYJ1_9ROSI